jgi:hypothetical protein
MGLIDRIPTALVLGAGLLAALPAAAADESQLVDAANSALDAVIEAAGNDTITQSRAILIAPALTDVDTDRAMLCVQLDDGSWSNPLLLTLEDTAPADQSIDLSGENLVLLAMTETGVAALTDDDPALGNRFDLAVINLSGGLASIPRLSGFDLIAFTDGPSGGAAIRSDTVEFVIDSMSNASLYGDYFVVTDILGLPNQFALFGTMLQSLESQ